MENKLESKRQTTNTGENEGRSRIRADVSKDLELLEVERDLPLDVK